MHDVHFRYFLHSWSSVYSCNFDSLGLFLVRLAPPQSNLESYLELHTTQESFLLQATVLLALAQRAKFQPLIWKLVCVGGFDCNSSGKPRSQSHYKSQASEIAVLPLPCVS